MLSSTEQGFDFDSRVSQLELEWHRAFEASIRARAEYHALAADPHADLEGVDRARDIYEQSEAVKSRVLDAIDLLEGRMAQQD